MLDVSFSCDDHDDNSKDCFEYKLWNPEAFKTLGRDPIDCNSAAVQNAELYKWFVTRLSSTLA